MEYQSTDEATRKAACERLKQIVKAIIAIKIKYYANFSKISKADKEKYESLEMQMNTIAEEHNLNSLKVALMGEASAKYDNGDQPDNGTRGQHEPEDLLKRCQGAVDAKIDALSKGRITQALRCQDQLKQYLQDLDESARREIIDYQRSRIEVLVLMREEGLTKSQVELKKEDKYKMWTNANMKGTCKSRLALQRREAMQLIESLLDKEKLETHEQQGDPVRR